MPTFGDLIRSTGLAHVWAGAYTRLFSIGPISLVFRRDARSIEFGRLLFRCNICGHAAEWPLAELGRESISCLTCGSSLRMRSIVHLLSGALYGHSLALPDFPKSDELVGLGLSDPEIYARLLAEKFQYANTFFHREPRLDIQDVPRSMKGSVDFLIASEVFEHVAPPVSKAFGNAYKLLKPGGFMVFSVPWSEGIETKEHFPDLHNYQLVKVGDEVILRNMTKSGEMQEYRELVFHGGPGETLEMRRFGKEGLIRDLKRAGFVKIGFQRDPVFEHGIYWGKAGGHPLIAYRPMAER